MFFVTQVILILFVVFAFNQSLCGSKKQLEAEFDASCVVFDCVRKKSVSALNLQGIHVERYQALRSLYSRNFISENSSDLKIPKVIHQIWIGPKPFPKNELVYVESIKKHHPGWEYKLWTNEDLKTFSFMNKKAFDNASNYGEKADILRYEILYQFGGVYLDTDMESLAPLDDLHYRYSFYTALAR